jgi:hypothetical protein
MLSGFMQNHAGPRKTCARIQEKQAPDRARLGGAWGVAIERHCYCNILSAEYDETLRNFIYKHSRLDHLWQQEDVAFSVILAHVSLIAPILNREEHCADQALITHYLIPSSNKVQSFRFGIVCEQFGKE